MTLKHENIHKHEHEIEKHAKKNRLTIPDTDQYLKFRDLFSRPNFDYFRFDEYDLKVAISTRTRDMGRGHGTGTWDPDRDQDMGLGRINRKFCGIMFFRTNTK